MEDTDAHRAYDEADAEALPADGEDVRALTDEERAAILVRNDKNSLIIFDITSDRIEITSNSEIGNVLEPVKAQSEGKDLKIAMNSKFIIEAINALSEENIVLSFNNNVQPFICQNEGDKDSLYLILPVRTSNIA